MSGNDPNHWEVVNDYSKTVVAIAAGFLAFTATFSGQLLESISIEGVPLTLLLCWLLLVLCIASALFAVARLTAYLQDKSKGSNLVILTSNLSYFSLLFAAGLFFVFVYSTSVGRNDINSEAYIGEQSARRFLSHSDSVFSTRAITKKVSWDQADRSWHFVFQTQMETVLVTVDSKTKKVINYQR